MRKPFAIALALTCGILASSAGIAKKNVLEFALEYRPTDVIDPTEVSLDPSMINLSVALEFDDGRVGIDALRIGTRTDDSDRSFDLQATSDVKGWVAQATRAVLADLGVPIDEQSDRVLKITLLQLSVKEANRPVGANYTGNVRLRLEVGPRSGGSSVDAVIASSEVSRYGKKFSADNANEVFSDAFIRAVTSGLGDPVLHRAWSGTLAGEPAAVDPPELLRQVQDLLGKEVATETLAAYVRGRNLSRPLSAEDVMTWKQAGIPDEVVRAALELSASKPEEEE